MLLSELKARLQCSSTMHQPVVIFPLSLSGKDVVLLRSGVGRYQSRPQCKLQDSVEDVQLDAMVR